jgi:hypothetical protein
VTYGAYGSINPGDYLIYWAEWDLSMMDAQPTGTYSLVDSSLLSSMNLVDAYPRLDEGFAYSGDGGADPHGYPGYSTSHACGWDFGCWLGRPTSEEQLASLRELPWGLGQATTGLYSQTTGGYKTFGGQGQSYS